MEVVFDIYESRGWWLMGRWLVAEELVAGGYSRWRQPPNFAVALRGNKEKEWRKEEECLA